MDDFLSKIPLFMNGELMENVQSVELNGETGLNEIVTMSKGFAGFSDGAAKAKISVTSAIPISGLEGDTWNKMVGKEWITLQVGIGGGDFVGNGKCTTCKISGSSDKAAECSWEWTGELGKLE